MEKIKNNEGFTLLEMLLVLMIVTAIFYIMVVNLDAFDENAYLNKEAELLGSAVDNTQSMALMNDKRYEIKISDEGFNIYQNNETQIYSHDFEQDIDISSNFSDDTISVTEDGTLSKAGTVTYKENNTSKKIIFSIGAGRYRIE